MSAGVDAVTKWSLRIHDRNSPRHHWCVATANAIVNGTELPPFPGKHMPGVPETRLDTIQRIIARETA